MDTTKVLHVIHIVGVMIKKAVAAVRVAISLGTGLRDFSFFFCYLGSCRFGGPVLG